MKRAISISLIFLFAFVGISGLMHQLEERESHTHEGGVHLCEADFHHNCSLCDTLPTTAFTSSSVFSIEKIAQFELFVPRTNEAAASQMLESKFGRAPPLS